MPLTVFMLQRCPCTAVVRIPFGNAVETSKGPVADRTGLPLQPDTLCLSTPCADKRRFSFAGEGTLNGEYAPQHTGESKIKLWKRSGHLGEKVGGMLVYDGGFQPCPRWVLVRGFEALTATALDEAIHGNTVHVGNLRGRYEEKERDVKEALSEFGQVLGITIRNRRHMQKPSWAL